MDKQNYTKINETILKQEEMLIFPHFSNKDAWDLGCFLVNKVYESNESLAVAIRKLNGTMVFYHAVGNTNQNNQNWMNRKFNTVCLMERSSLGAWASSFLTGEKISTHGLSDSDYVLCGGGFPIRLKTGEIVAVLTVSNFPHQLDHDFIVKGLKEWLKMEDVPDLDLTLSYE